MTDRASNVVLALGRLLLFGKGSKHRFDARFTFIASLVIKVGVSGAAVFYILHKLLQDVENLGISAFLSLGFTPAEVAVFLLAAIALTLLNWGLEAVKWHWLLAGEFGTRPRTAVKGVLSGTTFGIFTPNRTGEFIGRVLAVEGKNRIGATVLSFVNSFAQTLTTFSFGVAGLVYLLETLAITHVGLVPVRVLQVLLVAFWAVLMFLYFRVSHLEALFAKNLVLKRFAKHLAVLQNMKPHLINRLFGLSVLRFLTFVAQYLLVFGALDADANLLQVGSLAVLTMFSVMVFSMLPVPDLLMREAMALSYFGLFDFDPVMVSKSVFLVWCFNAALPALVGAGVLSTYRIFKGA